MKSKTHRTEITIETHSITIIRTSGNPVSAYCEHCQETVTAFSPKQAAGFLHLTLAEICLLIQSGQIHLTQTGRGTGLICGNLLKNIDSLREPKK